MDEHGDLQAFEERFERMAQWMRRSTPGLTRPEAEERALDYMATMPAWRGHPGLVARKTPRSKGPE